MAGTTLVCVKIIARDHFKLNYCSLISSIRVDIYVGPNQKHYSLPKCLLCYYSRYFDLYFNGKLCRTRQIILSLQEDSVENFSRFDPDFQGKTKILTLKEDSVKGFDILVEYMMMGRIGTDAWQPVGTGKDVLIEGLEFIKQVNKYDVPEVGLAALDALTSRLTGEIGSTIPRERITGSDVDTIFRFTPKDSPLRILAAKAALSDAGITNKNNKFEKQELELPEFAAAVLVQIREVASQARLTWRDPCSSSLRTCDD